MQQLKSWPVNFALKMFFREDKIMKFLIKKLSMFTCASITLIGLTGCDATSSMPSLDDLPFVGTTVVQISKPWQFEPLVTDNKCNTFTFDNVASFIDTYYVSTQGFESKKEATQIKLLENYLLSAVLVNRANLCLAEALELDKLMADLHEEKKILTLGSSISESDMEKHRKYSEKASDQIKQTIEEIDSLSPEKKERLTIGISTLIGGSFTFVQTYEHAFEVIKEVGDIKIQKNNNMMLQALEIGTSWLEKSSVLSIVYDGMYDVGSSWMESTTALYQFSQSNDIDIPPNATSMYRDMLNSQTVNEPEAQSAHNKAYNSVNNSANSD